MSTVTNYFDSTGKEDTSFRSVRRRLDDGLEILNGFNIAFAKVFFLSSEVCLYMYTDLWIDMYTLYCTENRGFVCSVIFSLTVESE